MARLSIPAIGLALGGLVFGVGGSLHPDAPATTVTEALGTMYESPLWTPAHLLALVGVLLIAISLLGLTRGTPVISGAVKVRPFAIAAAVGAVIAAIELVPHLLSSSEHAALREGDTTPLTDLHGALQIVATPALGLTVAALAVAVAASRERYRLLWWLAAIPAVLGGLTWAAAGPLVNLTHEPAFAALFTGAAGIAIWYLLAGLVVSIRSRRSPRTTVSS
ncbi:MAG: hypothetical protein ABIQ01_09860 [Pseudolysinimonas sp.]